MRVGRPRITQLLVSLLFCACFEPVDDRPDSGTNQRLDAGRTDAGVPDAGQPDAAVACRNSVLSGKVYVAALDVWRFDISWNLSFSWANFPWAVSWGTFPVEHRDQMVYVPGLASPLDDSRFEIQGEWGPLVCPGFTYAPPHWVHVGNEALRYQWFAMDGVSTKMVQSPGSSSTRCQPDGGYGPWRLRFIERPGGIDHSIGVSEDSSGLVSCIPDLTDGGHPIRGLSYRFSDGGVSLAPDAGPHCFELAERTAIVGSMEYQRDGGYRVVSELIRFETNGVTRLTTFPPGDRCSLSAGESALCVRDVTLSLLTPPAYVAVREWPMEVGDSVWPYRATRRGRQYVQRRGRDGGHSYYLLQGQELELLVDGLPTSRIGDWDDESAVVLRYADTDAGTRMDFERLCLP